MSEVPQIMFCIMGSSALIAKEVNDCSDNQQLTASPNKAPGTNTLMVKQEHYCHYHRLAARTEEPCAAHFRRVPAASAAPAPQHVSAAPRPTHGAPNASCLCRRAVRPPTATVARRGDLGSPGQRQTRPGRHLRRGRRFITSGPTACENRQPPAHR